MANDSERIFESGDEAFASMFRVAREAKGLTQDDVARHMSMRNYDFHQQTVYKIENGRRRVTVGEGVELASLVGLPVEALADRFPDSPESLANNVKEAGRTFGEELFDMADSMRALRAIRDEYVHAVRRYAEHPTAWAANSDGARVPQSVIFESLALFDGIQAYATSWQELLNNSDARRTLAAVGWDPAEAHETAI
ncbi:hypothetical protein B7R54_15160 [Subtercola boreus]|uniref:HTH cro/C1-type domain-containing protein n=1 Tax=Subtercola boreus TaxID=120213 RepID=A0A3E0VL82_9MICO|nr:helix-turn-helix transcriptional regulator [Subtercola boreus]RFA10395.1 hypothetical protein B7R54_15160 [Subtercola boreus]TQL56087.1 helix-turn-helix protein [Subtercola boreus]